MRLPLEGIRILDLSTMLPGPLCTQTLADFGADVIKIEQPKGGDFFRSSKPFLKDDTSSLFMLVNRNKSSLTINLKSEKGRQLFYQLVKKADVVVEQFRPGVVKKLKIDYDSLKAINPQIIYCSISGYGQDGPYRLNAGHDINYLGYSGILGVMGKKNEKPTIPSVQIADIGGGTFNSIIGILLALIARTHSGVGQFVDISMLDGAVGWLPYLASSYLATGNSPVAGDSMLTGGYAAYQVYETMDGKYLNIGAIEMHLWSNLCKFMGKPEFIPWQRVVEKQKEMLAFFSEKFKSKTRDEWLEALSTIDTCAGPVNTVEEAFKDPQILHREMLFEVEHPRLGKIKQIGFPIKLSATPARFDRIAPDLGEDNARIMSSLGYTRDQISEMEECGDI
jgi:crotonobetainyl-CoA:carnitine CoA-transferase CaiB-like acyl-CoA transferase